MRCSRPWMCAFVPVVALAASAAAQPNFGDAMALKGFDSKFEKLKARLSVVEPAEAEQTFKELRQTLDKVSAGGKAKDDWKRRDQELVALQAEYAKSRPAPAAGGAGPLQQFNELHAAHKAALEAPAGKDELELRCVAYELKGLLQLAESAKEAERVAAGQALERAQKALDAAFGAVAEAPWGSKERDRLWQIKHDAAKPLAEHELAWQDPKKVEAARARYAGWRKELDGMKGKLARTGHYVEAEAEWRRCSAALEKKVAASQKLGAEAGDVTAQLKLWQETFPLGTFAPRYRGARTRTSSASGASR